MIILYKLYIYRIYVIITQKLWHTIYFHEHLKISSFPQNSFNLNPPQYVIEHFNNLLISKRPNFPQKLFRLDKNVVPCNKISVSIFCFPSFFNCIHTFLYYIFVNLITKLYFEKSINLIKTYRTNLAPE